MLAPCFCLAKLVNQKETSSLWCFGLTLTPGQICHLCISSAVYIEFLFCVMIYGVHLWFFWSAVTYLQSNPGGVTIFGWTIDRVLINTIFFVEMSLVLFVLGKTITWTTKWSIHVLFLSSQYFFGYGYGW